MMEAFKAYFKTHAGLDDTDIEQAYALATPKYLHRNELLLQEGQVCRHKIFIVKGLLRTFGTAADGSEHILQFAPECSWTLDVESYDRQVPALLNIAAVEDSEVLLWAKADFHHLVETIPGLKKLSQQLISRNIYNSRQRLLATLGATPEEKYDEFVQAFPDLLSRLPLRMIAGYLGISVKTLTRIRHAQVHR